MQERELQVVSIELPQSLVLWPTELVFDQGDLFIARLVENIAGDDASGQHRTRAVAVPIITVQ